MNAARAYRARGIVLRARNLGEADRIITFFSQERGKFDAVAKGVRRPKSHLGGRLEFANEVELRLHRGRNLDVITSAEIVRANWLALVEPERFAVATLAIEVADALSEPDLPVDDVYALLNAVLGAVGRSATPASLVPRYYLRLLDALGLAPPVESCVGCGRDLAGDHAWLDEELGGLVCAQCHVVWRHAEELDADDLGNFRALSAPKGEAGTATSAARPRVARAVDLLVQHHLGRRPKAGAALAEFVQRAP